MIVYSSRWDSLHIEFITLGYLLLLVPSPMTSSLPPLAQAVSGALGSAAANSISYPLDLVATKLQTTASRSRKLDGLKGVYHLLKHIMRTEGLTGLYDGIGADTASTLISKSVQILWLA